MVIYRSLSRPQQPYHLPPFLALLVATVVLLLHRSKHLKLALVPPAHNIDPEAPMTGVIHGNHHLGRHYRIEQGRMHGTKDIDAPGLWQQSPRPGDGFERCTVHIGGSAVSLPATHRYQ